MTSFYIINGIILLIVFFLLLVLSMVWPPDSPWAPWWRTNKKTARAMCKLSKVKKGDVVFDLGSGDGESLIVAANEFHAKGIGIEIDPLRVFISRIQIFLSHANVSIRRNNLFEQDISKATVVFLYLVPKTLHRLKPKLLKELKKGTRIITVTYPLPGGLRGKAKPPEIVPLGVKKSLKLFKGMQRDKRKVFLYIV